MERFIDGRRGGEEDCKSARIGTEESWLKERPRREGKGTRLRRDRSGVEGVGWGGVRHTGFWFDWIAVGPRDWEEGLLDGRWFITT